MGRGYYRSTYCVLLDDADFQKLSPEARLLFWTMKHSPSNNRAGIYVFYHGAIEAQSGLDREAIDRAMDALANPSEGVPKAWIYLDRNVVWLRNQLKFDPTFSFANRNHVAGIKKDMEKLPGTELSNKFIEYYGLSNPFERLSNGSWNPSEGVPKQNKKEKENKKENLRSIGDGKKPAAPVAAKLRKPKKPHPATTNKKTLEALREYHSQKTGQEIPDLPIAENDATRRVVKVLDKFDAEYCRAVIRGHAAELENGGDQRFKEYTDAFPPERDNGRNKAAMPNWEWIGRRYDTGIGKPAVEKTKKKLVRWTGRGYVPLVEGETKDSPGVLEVDE